MIDSKKRVSDKVMDDAVHRLALMCVESSIKESHLDPVEFPNLVADQYCLASEMIRKRINEQRLTDGTYPKSWHGHDKTWFDCDVTEQVIARDKSTSRI